MGTSPRVLLLEPNAALRARLVALFAGAGFEIVVCASFVDVLAHAEALPDEVGVIDVRSTGAPTTERREQRRGLEHVLRMGEFLPLVVLTDEAAAHTGQPGDVGAAVISERPFDAQTLLGAVQHALCLGQSVCVPLAR